MKKVEEGRVATLPDHQSSNIAKGAEGTTSICRDHNIDTRDTHEPCTVGTNGQYNCHHQQCGRQVVCNWGKKEGYIACNPE